MELPNRPRTSKPTGRQPHHALSTAFVRNVAQAGRYCDGDGLYLDVQPTGTRSWVQRLVIRGRRRELGLGGFPLVPLKDARAAALANRRLARAGGDPLAEKRRLKSMPTFAVAAEAVLAQMRPGWRNPKHGKDWLSSMERFAFPRLGKLPVSEVTSADVVETLRTVWHERPATARRVRQRISTVMEYAVALNYRDDNPCSRIGPVLGPQQDLVQHMRALPHRDAAAVVAKVRASKVFPTVKLAFEFLVLTAARSGEVRGARWDEIDTADHVWTVPATRTKAKREHRVPLTRRAEQILDAARAAGNGGPLLFPSARGKRINDMALSGLLRTLEVPAVPHGFRSTFRDWAAEETNHPREVVEAALAHTVQNKVEAAYARSDLFERRRRLMDDWAVYLDPDRERRAGAGGEGRS
ncbi:MAG: tyrosine-type recombinase/integrase [Acidobacteria bacterium]|nr:tyrosine-type recombinase/integrase [Acidobacteriota bacterium]